MVEYTALVYTLAEVYKYTWRDIQRGHTLGGTYTRMVHTHDTEGTYTPRGYTIEGKYTPRDIHTEKHTRERTYT